MAELVGILNITPDSFSDGGQFVDPRAAITQAKKMFADGAVMVDVGAESTRPGATPLTPDQEWERLKDVLPLLMAEHPGAISLDTYHPETAERALALGDVIINDVTGLSNPAMVGVIARHNARCILSFLPAKDVQTAHIQEPCTSLKVVKDALAQKVALLRSHGVDVHKIIVDPGIGFGKTPALNRELLSFAQYMPDYKVMIGYSRKRFLGEGRMTLATNVNAGRIAIASGAAYLRVHDVEGHRALIGDKVFDDFK